MFELKNYQKQTLAVLRQYLDAARYEGAAAAFDRLRRSDGFSGRPQPYQTVGAIEDAPYVCLRLPTGGGKTLLAAHSIAVAAETYLEKDYPLVLWLMPTNTIRAQTLDTLKKPGHPNRETLLAAFGPERVIVIDIADFAQLRPQDLRDKVCLVVGTMATLRVEDREGRKVYAHNENLEPHFARIPPHAPDLERDEQGRLRFSFANLLAWHQPLVIVDEAHNAASRLSAIVMERINPACIIEFTATPASHSNLLHNVSATELKAEEMIKLPIVLTEYPTWQEAIRYSIDTREKLAELARRETDFVRPLVLLQAEEKNREVTVEVVKNYLLQERIAPERIAVATGAQRELDGINLLDPQCRIDFIITVEALKEGWDCPFAYIFCSVATVHSKRDVEQILGRVLRMPYARRRQQEELNKAYAHVAKASWPHAVNQLHDRLVDMGYDAQEAAQAIETPALPFPDLAAPPEKPPAEIFVFTLTEAPQLHGLDLFDQAAVTVTAIAGNRTKLEVRGPVTEELAAKLVQAVPPADRVEIKQTLAIHRLQQAKRLAPASRGEKFTVPQLCLWRDGELEPVEAEHFLDAADWNLLNYPAALSPEEFSIAEKAGSYSIDVMGKHLVTRYLGEQLTLPLHDVASNWTDLQLSRWLDEKCRQVDIRQEVTLEFARRVVAQLSSRRAISLATLVRTRFALKKALDEKIKTLRQQARKDGFQATLFGPQAAVTASYEYAVNFAPDKYPLHWPYAGRFQFNKHFYPMIGELKADGEEFVCAQAIDRAPHVKHWVRNLDSRPATSFFLPLATGRFYPDFVAQLNDGRVFVVEYKGAHLVEYEKEKRNVGELWEEKSNGQGLFLWAVKSDERKRDVFKQVEAKVAR